MSWKDASEKHKMAKTIPPKGYKSIEEISAEIGESLDYAKELVNSLVKEGKADKYNGKALSASRVLYPKVYYKLN